MRTRLVIVFLAPLIGVLLVLGGAFASSVVRSVQQEFAADQLGELGYFATSARQALTSGSFTVLDGEVQRYRELFGTRIVVVDGTETPRSSDGGAPVVLDEATSEQLRLALSGRRADAPPAVSPWSTQDAVMVEPVFDDRDVVGAIVVVASTDAARAEILRQWAVLGVIALLATSAGVLVVFRLANWVLAPVHRVDRAMAAIEHGDIQSRIADETGPPELRRTIAVFNGMAEEIERVVSREREFADNASHELRNPLNALLLRVEVLASGLGDEWADEVEEAREEGRRMSRMLDTLLGLARRGHGGADPAEVDLAAVVAGRLEAWREVAARKGVSLDLVAPARMPWTTDRTAVESALDAVIDNAVKFSPRGGRVEVAVERDGTGSRIAVRDHGPGLAEDEVDLAVQRFWRSDGHRGIPGSGLGLAIATDLLDSVGGRLAVASPPDGGLSVALELTGGGPR